MLGYAPQPSPYPWALGNPGHTLRPLAATWHRLTAWLEDRPARRGPGAAPDDEASFHIWCRYPLP